MTQVTATRTDKSERFSPIARHPGDRLLSDPSAGYSALATGTAPLPHTAVHLRPEDRRVLWIPVLRRHSSGDKVAP